MALLLACSEADARTRRSQSAKEEFNNEHLCPAPCGRKGPSKGYIIDQIKPLACDGAHTPYSMQDAVADCCRQQD